MLDLTALLKFPAFDQRCGFTTYKTRRFSEHISVRAFIFIFLFFIFYFYCFMFCVNVPSFRAIHVFSIHIPTCFFRHTIDSIGAQLSDAIGK